MWIPKNEAELLAVINSGELQETRTFDAKKEVPQKTVDLAVDVSALANSAGGTILIGLDEDENKRPLVPSPIELAGQRERIENIINTLISEVPYFSITPIESQANSSKGYLVLVVPPSERAPHMVIKKGEQRYYGRGETMNVILGESEVARLYERRELTKQSILPILEERIKESPIKEHNGFAHFHVVIKPVFHDEDILESALESDQNYHQFLNTTLEKIIMSDLVSVSYVPDFYVRGWIRQADGFLSKIYDSKASDYERHSLFVEADLDGSGYLFCNRAAETQGREDDKTKYFFSDIVAGNTIKFLAFFGEIYKKASYFGMVDIGVGLTGLEGSVEHQSGRWILRTAPLYEKSDYRRTVRVSAIQLKENPKQVASDLLMRLISAVSHDKYNPFK